MLYLAFHFKYSYKPCTVLIGLFSFHCTVILLINHVCKIQLADVQPIHFSEKWRVFIMCAVTLLILQANVFSYNTPSQQHFVVLFCNKSTKFVILI